MKVHTSENFYSLNRNFGFQPKIGGISEMKINRDLFCISLDLHYLCSDYGRKHHYQRSERSH